MTQQSKPELNSSESSTDPDRLLKDIQIECSDDTLDWFPDIEPSLDYLSICLAGETGEFCNIVKKMMRGSMDIEAEYTKFLLSMELVDTFIYVVLLANILGMDLAKAYTIKREQNVERFDRTVGEVE